MPIDKSWISKPRNTIEYVKGLNVFLDFAFEHGNGLVIKCPCSKCGFKKWRTRDVVQERLTCRAFPENYKKWYFHGEGSSVSEPLATTSVDMVEDILESRNPMEDMLTDVNDFNEAIEDDDVQNNMV